VDVVRRSGPNLPSLDEPDVEHDGLTQIPDDYQSVETPPAAAPAPAGELVRREISAEERRRVEQDPLVRQALELFDGVLIHVERRAAAPTVADPLAE